MLDLVIIGAGPAGLMAALEAERFGLDCLVIEKGLIANTIYNYPVGLTVFSTTNELEFTQGSLKPAREKPTREELLSYYVRSALNSGIPIHTEELVTDVTQPEPHIFAIRTGKREYTAKNVLFAIGAMDHPRKLGVPGEDLPHVHNSFRETYPWVRKKALVIGGGNSAGEAALFLAEEGADTTLAIYRDDWTNTDPKQGCIKYWVKQPLENALGEHCLSLFYLGSVVEFRENETVLKNEAGEEAVIPTDVVFVLIGSDADLGLLKNMGVETREGKYGEVPVYSETTFETNVPGVYAAGHFTEQRHIKGAIDAAKQLMPRLVESLKQA